MKIYMDIETSGLIRAQKFPDILQIAAVTDDGDTFMRYLRPTKSIGARASSIHGLFTNSKRQLLRKNELGRKEPLPAEEPSEGLQQFFDWAQNQGEDVKLVAYNGEHFDFRIVKYHAMEHGVEAHGLLKAGRLEDPILGIRKQAGMPYHWKIPKLVEVCAHLGIEFEQTHDAMADAVVLMKIMQKLEK